jgi:dynein heavy chain 2
VILSTQGHNICRRDGKLRVNFSDRLVTLLREVRQLTSFGFIIPSKIQLAATTAKKFYRYGVVLKQVAHFYNSIDEQIIESQVYI